MLAEELVAQHAKFTSSYNFGPSDEDVWPVERIATNSRICGATARPGFAIQFPACTRIMFSGWMPAGLV